MLSPFERLEREFDSETAQQQQQSFSSLSSFASGGQSLYVRPAMPVKDASNDSSSTFRSLSFLPKQSITDDDDHRQHSHEHAAPLSPDKTSALIDSDERLVASRVTQDDDAREVERPKNGDGEAVACTVESQSCIPVDTVSRRDYECVQDYKPPPPPAAADEKKSAQSNLAQLAESSNETTIAGENADRLGEPVVPNENILSDDDVEDDEEDDDDDDDEDFDVIKNDIISRVDDDKDDFMLDTNYLKESSSRYLFHHSGSELILAPYSELSSITEEDEEEEAAAAAPVIAGNLTFDNKQSLFTSNFPAVVEGPRLPVTDTADYDDSTIDTITSEAEHKEEIVENNAIMNPRADSVSPDWTVVEEKSSEASVRLPAAKTADSPVNNGHSSPAVEESMKDDIGSLSPSAVGEELSALPEEHHRSTSSNSSSSSSSSSSSLPKVSLNNVFDFLNEAADDFEFVERMLELTNDKIGKSQFFHTFSSLTFNNTCIAFAL